MSKHGFGIDRLAAMHHELGQQPQSDCPERKRPARTAAPEDGDKRAEKAPQGELFYEEERP